MTATAMSPTAAAGHEPDVLVLSTGDVRVPRYAADIVLTPRLADQPYGPPAGHPELRHLIAARSGPTIEPGQVVVTPGARQAIVVVLKAVLADRHEVLVISPYWASYPSLVDLAGGRAVIVTGRVGDASPDLVALDAACTARTGAVILNSPRNPDGAIASAAAVRSLVDWAERRRLTVLFDQVYRGVALTGEPAPSPIQLYRDLPPNCVVVDGLSKSHALAGLRIGWVVAGASTAAEVTAVASHLIGGTSTIAQDMAAAVLQSEQGHLPLPDATLEANLERAMGELADLPGVACPRPSGGIFLFPDVRGWLRTSPPEARHDVVAWLARRHRVAVVDGAAFGASGHLRLSFAIPPDQLSTGVRRLRAALATSSLAVADGTG